MVFTLGPAAHLPCLAARAGLGTIVRSSCIVRFVQGGVVKTFRCPLMNPRTRNVVTVTIILFTLLTLAYLSIGPIRSAYVAHRISSASTPGEELSACRLLNAWEYWYSVSAFDSLGSEIKPHQTGNYDAVESVAIVLQNGTSIKRQILNRDSLSYIYGE